jgi:hypothetical protein
MLDQETVVWYSADVPPDADTTVLVYAPGSDEPVWLGYYDGFSWFEIGGAEYGNAEELADRVTAWAPLPAGAVCAEDAGVKAMRGDYDHIDDGSLPASAEPYRPSTYAKAVER